MDHSSPGITTEWIILSDHAEVISGKLYLMGGGWENLTVNQPLPVMQHCGIAVAFSVPWNETNQRHPMAIQIADADGTILAKIGGELEVGRPPGIQLGQAQRVPMALNLPITLEHIGTYAISAHIHDEVVGRITFNVSEGPALALFRGMQQQMGGTD